MQAAPGSNPSNQFFDQNMWDAGGGGGWSGFNSFGSFGSFDMRFDARGSMFGSGGLGYDDMGFRETSEPRQSRSAQDGLAETGNDPSVRITLPAVEAERPQPRLTVLGNVTETIYKDINALSERERNIFLDRAPSGNMFNTVPVGKRFVQVAQSEPVVVRPDASVYRRPAAAPQNNVLYVLERQQMQVDSEIDHAELEMAGPQHLPTYGDVIAARRSEQLQPRVEHAHQQTRMEYLQSRWGRMTEEEAREYIGEDNRRLLNFATQGYQTLADPVIAVVQGDYKRAAIDVAIPAALKSLGLAWKAFSGKLAASIIPIIRKGIVEGAEVMTPVGKGRGYSTMEAFKKAEGRSFGEGFEQHHIVNQNRTNLSQFPVEWIHNTKNVVVSRYQHIVISAEYSTKDVLTGKTMREIVSELSYEEQFNYGLKVMERHGAKYHER